MKPVRKRLEVGEDGRDLGRAAARIELFDQRIIGRKPERCGAELRLLAGKGDDPLEGRQKAVPVVLGAQAPPQLLAADLRIDLAADEIGREAGAVAMRAFELAERGLL